MHLDCTISLVSSFIFWHSYDMSSLIRNIHIYRYKKIILSSAAVGINVLRVDAIGQC